MLLMANPMVLVLVLPLVQSVTALIAINPITLWKIASKKNGVPPHMRKHYPSSNNAAAEGGDIDMNSSTATHDTKGVSAPPSLTQDQYNQLMNLLHYSSVTHGSDPVISNQVSSFQSVGPSSAGKQGKIGSNFCFSFSCHNIALDTWIIDSGASHHICASLHWFHSYSEINPMIIKLPNGEHVTTKYAGTIIFSPLFRLIGVLFVPNFNINLISVSLLCHNALCSVHFTDTTCLIQEQKSMKTIGSAERRDGLYHLVQTNKASSPSNHGTSQPFISANNATLPASALWHFRLRNLSNSRITLLQSKSNTI
jgi:hypothetical protein